MSKLEKLIAKLCPDGVEYTNIGSVVNYEQPSKYIVKDTDYSDNFFIPVLTAGQSFILGYTDETDNLYNASKEKPVIIFDDFTGAFKWVDFPFKVKSSAMKMLTADTEKTTLKYIYHIMGNIGYSSDKHKRLWISTYSEINIPLPPLQVQSEIVRILDNFTELTAELTAKLKAELSARKRQYEYYRDTMLTCDKQIPIVRLKDISSFYNGDRGKNYPKVSEMVSEGIPFVNAGDVNGVVDYMGCKKIAKEKYDSMSGAKLKKGDILYCLRGSTGKNGIYERDEGTVASSLVAIRANGKVHYKYLYYLLNSSMERKQRMKSDTGAAQPNLSAQSVGNYEFPLPTLEVQTRIVNFLDHFDSLCNDISKDLPAEIEARQKQYEYYRDKLLTFKKLA